MSSLEDTIFISSKTINSSIDGSIDRTINVPINRTISSSILNLPYSKTPTQIYNDNQACLYWSYSNTSKGLHHIQIKENAVRENIQNKSIKISHVDGKTNIADIFTKEDKDTAHYLELRDLLLYHIPVCSNSSLQ